jgi:hypothetical protein
MQNRNALFGGAAISWSLPARSSQQKMLATSEAERDMKIPSAKSHLSRKIGLLPLGLLTTAPAEMKGTDELLFAGSTQRGPLLGKP